MSEFGRREKGLILGSKVEMEEICFILKLYEWNVIMRNSKQAKLL